MPRIDKKLSVTQIRSMNTPGRFNDGSGLYLLVMKSGERYWVFRYRNRVTGKQRDKGLGPLRDVSLKEAREKALDYRNALRDGFDPIDQSRQTRIDAKLKLARQISFGDCISCYIDAHRDGWRNAKHTTQWENTLETYCADLKSLPVSNIDTALVMQCLEPIWSSKTETATRVRQQ